ncbi:MAG TPA: hypothetical protein VJ732_20130 [Bryobacteraceae bacterium]|nr:hypothetical protein [Bryobacteraceae bacterium]
MSCLQHRSYLFLVAASFCFLLADGTAHAQAIGPNIDVVQSPVLSAGGQACTPPACDQFNKMLETDIAASPLNPARAITVFNDYRYSLVSGQSWCTVSYTKDGGYLWKNFPVPSLPGTPAQQSGNFCTDPAAVWDVSGTAHVVMLAGTSGNDTQVFVMNLPEKKDPSGDLDLNSATFTQVDLGQNYTGAGLDKPSIAYANGIIHVSYAIFDGSASRTKIMYARSLDNGATFSKPIKLNGTLKTNNQTATIVGADGTVYIFWATDDPTQSGIVFVTSTNGGKSFSNPSYVVGVPSPFYPYNQFAFPVSSGFLSDRSEVAPTVIAAGPAPGVAGSKDRLLVAWQEYVDVTTGRPASPVDSSGNVVPGVSPRLVVTASFDQGQTWVPRVAVEIASADAMQVKPRMATSGGLASLLFEDARGGGCAYGIPAGTGFGLPLMNGLTCQRNIRVAQADLSAWTSGLPDWSGSQVVTRFPQKNGQIVSRQGNCVGGYCPAVYEPNHPSSAGGTIAFTGDYLGHSPDHPLVKDPVSGNWRLPLQPGDPKTFLAAWDDNRWEKLPLNAQGLPEENAALWGPYDPVKCINLGTRNTKPFFAKVSPGLAAFWTGTDKPLQTASGTVVQVVATIQNLTGVDQTVQVTLTPGSDWSFSSVVPLSSFVTTIGRYSSISKILTRMPGSTSPAVQVAAMAASGLTAGFTFNVSQTVLAVSGALNNLSISPLSVQCLNSSTSCNGTVLKGTFNPKTQPSATFSFDTSGSGTFSFDTFSFDTFSFDTFSFDTGAFSDSPDQDVTWNVTGTGASVTPSNALTIVGNGQDLINAGYGFQLLYYKTYTIPDFDPASCKVVGSPIDQAISNVRIYNQPNSTQIANNSSGTFSFDTFSFDTQSPSEQISNASFPVANGDQVNVTLRAYIPQNTTVTFNPTNPTVGISQSTVSQTRNPDGTPVVAAFSSSIPPVITASATVNGAPYVPGTWTNQNVVVTFSCTDAGAPVASVTGPQTVSTQGANQSASGTCTDAAGNSATVTFSGIDIDKTPPTIVASISPAAVNGWYNIATGPPTISFVCSDALSGIAPGSCPAPVTLGEGVNQSLFRTVTDLAGNVSAPAGFSGLNVDLTAPTVTITTPGNGATYILNAKVAANYTCADTPSGIATCSGPVSGSNLPTGTLGKNTFSVTATDKAGNTTTQSVTYYVVYNFVLTPPKSPANLGSAVPLIWQLTDANGKTITDMTSLVTLSSAFTPGVQQVNGVCHATYPGTVQVQLYNPATGATGGSNFRQVSGGFQFNWDTSTASSTGAGCYTLIWQFKDDAGPAPGFAILNPALLHMTAVQLQ